MEKLQECLNQVKKMLDLCLAERWWNKCHGASISVKDYPGVLFDVKYDDKGDLDRESFIVKVVNGKPQVVEILKPAK